MSFLQDAGSFFIDIIETVVVALSIFLILYLFIMQPHQVNGQSMEPNFHNAEYLMTDKISYKIGLPKRGDIVVFEAPPAAECPEGTGCDFIKRVIGLPGDTVEVKDGHLYVNNQLLKEPYLDDSVVTDSGPYTQKGPITVPEGSYFVCGDNRPHSSDSRYWGPVELKLIVGKVFLRYFPINRIGIIRHATYEF
jgi:signal peptidase I